jgi:2-C-methyl-D-erythritol 4-phosphate cytidylyltransferase
LPPATAIVAAAGSGERLGAGGPKALVALGGRPMLEWSLVALRAVTGIGKIVVALPPGADAELSAGVEAVEGGTTRARSVAVALDRVDTEVVLIQDAARPLVTAELIDAVLTRLAGPGVDGVIAAAPVTDTIKRVEGHAIVATEDRSALWAAQTPQAFRTAALLEAIAAAGAEAATATDEAALVEWAGGMVTVEPAPPTNLKVTTPDDLRLAELLLGER